MQVHVYRDRDVDIKWSSSLYTLLENDAQCFSILKEHQRIWGKLQKYDYLIFIPSYIVVRLEPIFCKSSLDDSDVKQHSKIIRNEERDNGKTLESDTSLFTGCYGIYTLSPNTPLAHLPGEDNNIWWDMKVTVVTYKNYS